MFEAMQYAHTPAWLALLNPLIGALGVLIGGRGLRREQATSVGAARRPPQTCTDGRIMKAH